MNFLMKPLVYLGMKYAQWRGTVRNIMDRENSDIYMIRYIVFKSRFCSIYIHRFLRSDLDTPHDHPWNFFTYVVEKGYTEELMTREPKRGLLTPIIVNRKPGSLAYRKAEAMHRVILDRDYSPDEQAEAPLTVCLMLKRRRMWGFIKPYYSNSRMGKETESPRPVGYSWHNWKDYLDIDENHPAFFGSE